MTNKPIDELILAASAVAEDAQACFGSLSAQQVNWKPDANRWSVGQCLDHLLTANAGYFPIFDQVLDGTLKRAVWQRLPLLPALWGKMLLDAVSPETTRKSRAPKVFQPASSDVDGAIVDRFVEQQERTVGYMRTCEDLDLDKIIIPSPVTSVITYSLMDAFRVIVAHEQRHILQAKRVSETDGFPD